MLSPVGAGALAEITLENIFKASNLLVNHDYIMQYSVSDSFSNLKLRPDAVLFLPAGNVMIVDSKASKYFMELVENIAEQQLVGQKLKTTMRSHLKDLITKDYKELVKASIKKLKPNYEVKQVTAIMFLPSESALEKLNHIDKEFLARAWEAEIIPAGPIGLINILSHARYLIAQEKQLVNNSHIIDEIRKLIISLSTMHDYIKKIGSSLFSATNNYDKLAGSFNSNILTKTRNLQQLGINLPTNKIINVPLERYQVISTSNNIIETEISQDASEQISLVAND